MELKILIRTSRTRLSSSKKKRTLNKSCCAMKWSSGNEKKSKGEFVRDHCSMGMWLGAHNVVRPTKPCSQQRLYAHLSTHRHRHRVNDRGNDTLYGCYLSCWLAHTHTHTDTYTPRTWSSQYTAHKSRPVYIDWTGEKPLPVPRHMGLRHDVHRTRPLYLLNRLIASFFKGPCYSI